METGESRYREIANELRKLILASDNGAKMPDERTLSSKYCVSRQTVRRALRILEEEKLIRRVQGSGTYMSPVSARRIPLMIDYAGSMREYAPSLRRKLLRMELRPAEAGIAAELNVAVNAEILFAERADFLKDLPIAYDLAYLNMAYAESLKKEDLEHIDFIEWWTARFKFSIGYCTQSIEAVPADRTCVSRLGVTKGAPLLKTLEHYYVKRGLPAGFFISFYNPNYIAIRNRYEWSSTVRNEARK